MLYGRATLSTAERHGSATTVGWRFLDNTHNRDLTFAAVQSGYAVTLYLQPSQKKACVGRGGSVQVSR